MRPHHHLKPFARPQTTPTVSHTISIRPVVFYLSFAGLVAANILTLVGFLMAPDIGRLFNGQNQAVVAAYEDRVAQLRLEVDRLQSRHYAQSGNINLQLQEVAQQQEELLEQHQYVKLLADKAAALGVDVAPTSPDDATADPKLVGALTAPAAADPAAEVDALSSKVGQMMTDSRMALAALSTAATEKTGQIVDSLAEVGIKTNIPTGDDEDAVGGPLLPPVDGPAATPSLADDASDVVQALAKLKAAQNAAESAPVHQPLANATRISSIFGNRKDPFTGRLAFHPGIDFAASQGTTVLSAGDGTVSFVGQINGYGNVVEVTHQSGLITRYGHLSGFLVHEGDKVDTGSPIALVGSTGRSTGPHLHFEVRRSDDAINPAPFLAVGRTLQKVLAS